jgi:hypothetical protein
MDVIITSVNEVTLLRKVKEDIVKITHWRIFILWHGKLMPLTHV